MKNDLNGEKQVKYTIWDTFLLIKQSFEISWGNSRNDLIRRKLFCLETLTEGPVRVHPAMFDRVAGILLWQENANFAIIPHMHVSLVRFKNNQRFSG